MSEQTYTAAQLEQAFGPGAAEHAANFMKDLAGKDVPAAVADGLPLAKGVVGAAKIFYHLYVCPFIDCLKKANPISGSWHQRGVHLASSTPRTDVLCPGCGNQMVIGRNGLDSDGNPLPQGQLTSDANGNAIMHGQPIIQEAPGQPDQTAEIEKENEQ